MKLNRNIINKSVKLDKRSNENLNRIYNINKKELEIKDYDLGKTAYNPKFKDTNKIVSIPEDILYKNERHHQKDFIIVDGDVNDNTIIGFLGSSKPNKNRKSLTVANVDDIKYVNKELTIHNKGKKRIKNTGRESSKKINGDSLKEIKELCKKNRNVILSKKYRKK